MNGRQRRGFLKTKKERKKKGKRKKERKKDYQRHMHTWGSWRNIISLRIASMSLAWTWNEQEGGKDKFKIGSSAKERVGRREWGERMNDLALQTSKLWEKPIMEV